MKKSTLLFAVVFMFTVSVFSQSFDEKWGAAMDLKKNEQYNEAIAALNSLLLDCGQSGVPESDCQCQIYNQISRCYFKLKDYTNSGLIAQKAIALNPQTAEPYTYLIYGKWLGESDFAAAESILKDAESKFTDSPDLISAGYYIYHNKANRDYDKDDYTLSIANYNKALSYKKEGKTYSCLASTYYAIQDYANAISNYNQAIALGYIDGGEVYYELAGCYYANRDFETAIYNYRMAINSGYSVVDVYVYLANSCYALERYADCKSALQSAYNIDSGIFSTRENLQAMWDYVSEY